MEKSNGFGIKVLWIALGLFVSVSIAVNSYMLGKISALENIAGINRIKIAVTDEKVLTIQTDVTELKLDVKNILLEKKTRD